MNFIVISSLIAFFGTLLVMPSVIKLAISKRFLVGGGGRNAHEGFTPNVGGMAIFAGLLLANQYLLFYFFDTFQYFEIYPCPQLFWVLRFIIFTVVILGAEITKKD